MKNMICNQRNMPDGALRYGLRRSADTGCGWVATYNALKILGKRVQKEALIRYYERQLPLVHGSAGTSFWGPAVCFRNWQFPTKLIFDRSQFDEAAKNADVCILFYRWRKKAKLGAHFVALHHTEQGIIAYNTYRNSKSADHYGPSLETFLRKRKYFGAVLIGIRKPEEAE